MRSEPRRPTIDEIEKGAEGSSRPLLMPGTGWPTAGKDRVVAFQRSLVLDPGTTAARMARDAVRGWLLEWGFTPIVDDLVLIGSELVTNALRYGSPPVEVSLSAYEAIIELVVCDRERGHPIQPERAASLAENGRGLALVDYLADQWGVTELLDGKQVWARLTTPTTHPG